MTIHRDVLLVASPGLTQFMRLASWAGSGWVLWPAGVLLVALLARAGRVRDAILFAIAVAGANLVDESMKLLFQRARPQPYFGYPLPGNYSFPSGHAFVSCCFFLCLAEILVRDRWPLAWKSGTWLAASMVTLTIGASRVYLGVHYPTDVLGGFAGAILWTTAIRVAHHKWRGRRERNELRGGERTEGV